LWRIRSTEDFILRTSLSSFGLCLGLLTVLSACSSGSSGPGTPAGDPSLVAKATARGQFTIAKQTKLSEYGGIPDGYELTPAMTCGDVEAFDSRLKAGDTFGEIQMSASRTSGSNATLTSLIQSIDATHMSEETTISDIATTPATSGIPAQVQIQSNCAITTDKQEPFKCDFKYVNWQPPTGMETQSESCESDFSSNRFAKTTGTVALGTYRLASGQTVTAQSTHRVATNVDIKCGKNSAMQLVGTGSVITDEVVTRDLVSRDASMCTPTNYVYRKTVYQLDNGTILYADGDEKTQAPQR
jgi:hypothetical protein